MVLAGALLVGAVQGAMASSPLNYTVTTSLTTRATGLGPNHDQYCDIVYDLYVPNSASPKHRVPSVLTTNGFGGSKNDQSGFAGMLASHGYVVISYSGLGFGGSSCAIAVDSPEWDGRAASHMVDLLAARNDVIKDGPNDPRVGTWGGSYGGGFQFALASQDSRVDAMIPIITWNDLAYSLIPNNDSKFFNYAASPPGVEKVEWSSLFFADGNAQVALNAGKSGWISGNPPNPQCPGFIPQVCLINTESLAVGYGTADTTAFLRHASAEYEFFQNPAVKRFPPTMLVQGETDSLFNIQDAVANYHGFKAHHAPVKLVLQLGGHSGPGAAGEVNHTDISKGYEDQLWLNWFDHYLKKLPVSTGPEVEYFRDWVPYDPTGSAQAAYGSAPAWPVGSARSLYLSSDGTLASSTAGIKAGAVSFFNPPNGSPSSYSETSGQQTSSPFSGIAPSDPPNTFAAFSTPALTSDVISVGIPSVTFRIQGLNPVSPDPSTEIVLFGKIYDVAPDGSVNLVHRLVAPIRIADTFNPVHLNLPGVVHKYAAGHRIELVLATTDQAYVGARTPNQYTITIDPADPFVLSLPVSSS